MIGALIESCGNTRRRVKSIHECARLLFQKLLYIASRNKYANVNRTQHHLSKGAHGFWRQGAKCGVENGKLKLNQGNIFLKMPCSGSTCRENIQQFQKIIFNNDKWEIWYYKGKDMNIFKNIPESNKTQYKGLSTGFVGVHDYITCR